MRIQRLTQTNPQHLLFIIQVRSLPPGELPVNTLLPLFVAESNGTFCSNQLHAAPAHPSALADDSLPLQCNTEWHCSPPCFPAMEKATGRCLLQYLQSDLLTCPSYTDNVLLRCQSRHLKSEGTSAKDSHFLDRMMGTWYLRNATSPACMASVTVFVNMIYTIGTNSPAKFKGFNRKE